jgi:hypothetical protein
MPSTNAPPPEKPKVEVHGHAEPETSADWRQHKRGAAYAEAGLTFTPVAGVRGDYFLSPDTVVTASYLTGSAGDIITYEYDKTALDVKLKRFLTNSFYADAGLGYERFAVSYDVFLAGQKDFKKLHGVASNVGVEAHIGNQWQWKVFSLGCDWVGYFAALSKSFKGPHDTAVDQADQKDREGTAKANLNAGSAHALRLYLGGAF